jgi:hypothetical protein
MSDSVSRRAFVKSGLLFLGAGRATLSSELKGASARAHEVVVTLEGRAAKLGRETVNFGLPLPPGFLSNPRRVRVATLAGEEINAAVRALEPWRIGGRDGSIRSLLIQFQFDFSREQTQRIKIVFQQPRRKNLSSFVPVAETLLDEEGLKGPRVLALLPARWLCDSWIVGPQTSATESGQYGPYDQFVERNFSGSLTYLNSQIYSEWLFDRTTAYYKMYVRTGDRKFLEAAYHAAHFVRLHTKMSGPDAGIFTLKGPDLKYVYPRAMHIHYLLTGDERAREAGKIMARYCIENQDAVYQPESITPSPLGVDPERGRKFWTLRHQGYGLLGILHGWELTGDRAYWAKARECVDAYYRHQQHPPDGRPPDGSLRQDWALYDPSEATFKGATSAWMMALLLDPLFHYWTLTGDKRVPDMVIKWCDFLDRQGMVPDGSKAYYVINCFAALDQKEPPSALGPDMEMHNAEMAYTFALGSFFSVDPKQLHVYRKRFDQLFPLAAALDVNHPARAFNWAFQFSSQLIYFMQHAGAGRLGAKRKAA